MTQIDGRPSEQTIERTREEPVIPAQQSWSPAPQQLSLTDEEFELGPNGVPPDKRFRALNRLAAFLEDKRDHMLGYQVTEDMDAYQEDLSRFMKMHCNNLGDPFQAGGYKVNTKPLERAVLKYFTKLWHGIPYKAGKKDSCWGYGLSMGATEGNLYAMWNARDYLEGKRLLSSGDTLKIQPLSYVAPMAAEGKDHAYEPVIFYSQDTHYSFAKAIRVLKLPTFGQMGRDRYPNDCPLGGEWPDEVPSALPPKTGKDDQYPSFGPGSIDVDKLVVLVKFFAEKGYPIIVNLNYGSTFKCAYDDVRAVSDRLITVFGDNGLISRDVEYEGGGSEKRRGFWIHVDGALGAGYMPFLDMAAKDPKYGYEPEVDIPEFDFGLKSTYDSGLPGEKPVNVDMVSSIALSGHKWMGAPWPCGILVTKVKYQMQPPGQAEYIGSLDTTFAGSRNGFSPIVMWDHLAQHPDDRQISKAVHSQRMAAYLVEKLKMVEKYWRNKNEDDTLDLFIDRTPLAITVRFRRPNPDIVAKYSLSTVTMRMIPDDDTSIRHLAHAFCMSFTTQDRIDTFALDLCGDDAFDFDETTPTPQPSPRFDAGVPMAQSPFADRGFA
ncbi:PLP-dependent aminotransferase family protein [Actinokineospora iranica]|uniref:L-histidine carboxy-lyase (Histamine-forming) n=1 Tax=Actinokineospora iranica TaxID=1271860 RepID=A0A1G6KJG9_9PSEU|nr:histidine decarboxylase [Actinokineospora iranica]SDC31262.1 L-histidine carboxy-lyase (histamine-forming) [Actinokineospora iranica]